VVIEPVFGTRTSAGSLRYVLPSYLTLLHNADLPRNAVCAQQSQRHGRTQSDFGVLRLQKWSSQRVLKLDWEVLSTRSGRGRKAKVVKQELMRFPFSQTILSEVEGNPMITASRTIASRLV